MSIDDAARATRKFWPVPHWEYPDAYFAATDGYDPENVGEIYSSYQEAQAECDRLNLIAVLKSVLVMDRPVSRAFRRELESLIEEVGK